MERADAQKIISTWDPKVQSMWQELLQNDRARNVEDLFKCLLKLCFLIASCELQKERYERSNQVLSTGQNTSGPSSLGKINEGTEKEVTTLQTIEALFRASDARVRLVACKRGETYPDDFVFKYPGCAHDLPYYVSICIEGRKSALEQAEMSGWEDETENQEALKETGFVVRDPQRSTTAMADQSMMDLLQNLPDHVQLAHDSPLLPNNIPSTWLPPHCCNCRRIASLPTTLYKLPCCEAMYCCSSDCWNEHASNIHRQEPLVIEQKDTTNAIEQNDTSGQKKRIRHEKEKENSRDLESDISSDEEDKEAEEGNDDDVDDDDLEEGNVDDDDDDDLDE